VPRIQQQSLQQTCDRRSWTFNVLAERLSIEQEQASDVISFVVDEGLDSGVFDESRVRDEI
jgi:hypothetical protein